MWLSLIIALLAYLLSPRDTADERRRALLGAAAAGGATYAVTEYTDWGKTNLKPLDGAIGNAILPGKDPGATNGVPGGSPVGTGGVATGGASVWSGLSGWVAPALAGAGVAGAIGTFPSWVLPVAAGLLIYFVLKD